MKFGSKAGTVESWMMLTHWLICNNELNDVYDCGLLARSRDDWGQILNSNNIYNEVFAPTNIDYHISNRFLTLHIKAVQENPIILWDENFKKRNEDNNFKFIPVFKKLEGLFENKDLNFTSSSTDESIDDTASGFWPKFCIFGWFCFFYLVFRFLEVWKEYYLLLRMHQSLLINSLHNGLQYQFVQWYFVLIFVVLVPFQDWNGLVFDCLNE